MLPKHTHTHTHIYIYIYILEITWETCILIILIWIINNILRKSVVEFYFYLNKTKGILLIFTVNISAGWYQYARHEPEFEFCSRTRGTLLIIHHSTLVHSTNAAQEKCPIHLDSNIIAGVARTKLLAECLGCTNSFFWIILMSFHSLRLISHQRRDGSFFSTCVEEMAPHHP